MKIEVVAFDDADSKLTSCLQGGYERVLAITGNVSITGDFLAGIKKLQPKGAKYDVITIRGNVVVKGRLAMRDVRPCLSVSGTTTAETIEAGDCEMFLRGGTAKYFVLVEGNDGTLDAGKFKTPWVIDSDHDLEISTPKSTITVNQYGSSDSVDYNRSNIAKAFVPEVLEGEHLDPDKLYARMKAKKPVLVKGAQTVAQIKKAEVAAALKPKEEVELDLSNKKLTSFPKNVLKLTGLKRLVLDQNKLGSIPKEIGKLTELEVLSIQYCSVKALPESLSQLTKLRELYLDGSTFSLPKSFGTLPALEVLSVGHLCGAITSDDPPLAEFHPWEMPASVGELPKLRKLIGRRASLEGSGAFKSLEEVIITGGSDRYLKRFPEWVTRLPKLKVLDLGSNFIASIPASFEKLRSLESFDLEGLARLDKLPDFSKFTNLKELHLSARNPRTDIADQPIDILLPLFSMKLDSLEKLSIDRWGTDKDRPRGMRPESLAGIHRFAKLKWLDLSFNELSALHEDFFNLRQLEYLNLQYNPLPAAVRARIAKTYPHTKIDFRNTVPSNERAKVNPVLDLLAKARGAAQWEHRLEEGSKFLAQAFAKIKAGDAATLLVAHHARMTLGREMAKAKKSSATARAQALTRALADAEVCLSLLPDLSKVLHLDAQVDFQRAVLREASDLIAGAIVADPKASPESLTWAAELGARGVAAIETSIDGHVFQPYIHALWRLGRKDEAHAALARAFIAYGYADELHALKRTLKM